VVTDPRLLDDCLSTTDASTCRDEIRRRKNDIWKRVLTAKEHDEVLHQGVCGCSDQCEGSVPLLCSAVASGTAPVP
jgi:hypothetical protein